MDVLPAFFFSLLVLVYADPLPQEPPPGYRETETGVNLISYIQNFKQIMTEYIEKHHRNLTYHERDTIKHILEDFLKNFADDLAEAIKKQNGEKDGVIRPRVEYGLTKIQVDESKSKVAVFETYKKLDNDTGHKDFTTIRLEVSDGVLNDSYDLVKAKLKEAMPEIKEEVADFIVTSLKNNVDVTKAKLEKILRKDDVESDEVDLD